MICSNDDYDDENSDNYDDDSNNDVNDGNNDVDNGDGNFYDWDDDLDDSNHCWLTAWGKCLLDSPIPDNIIACYQHSGQSRHTNDDDKKYDDDDNNDAKQSWYQHSD